MKRSVKFSTRQASKTANVRTRRATMLHPLCRARGLVLACLVASAGHEAAAFIPTALLPVPRLGTCARVTSLGRRPLGPRRCSEAGAEVAGVAEVADGEVRAGFYDAKAPSNAAKASVKDLDPEDDMQIDKSHPRWKKCSKQVPAPPAQGS